MGSATRASLVQALRRQPRNTPLAADLSDVVDLVSPSRVTGLLCEEGYVRTLIVAHVVQASLTIPKVVAYIDIDTLYSIYLQDHPELHSGDLMVATPDESTIDDVVAHVASALSSDLGLVVFDSVTMFYHIFSGRASFGQRNRKLSVYFALFRRLAGATPLAVLVTSFARARRLVMPAGEQWGSVYSGGRVLDRGCDVLLRARRTDGSLALGLLKHYDAALQGKSLWIPLR